METHFLSSADIKDVLNLIEDGFLFERLGQEFLTARLGYQFMSSGGIKDRGIDGFEYISETIEGPNDIFQISIDKKADIKIEDTVVKLKKNEVSYARLTYVTNIQIKNKDELIDHYISEWGISLRIFDAIWIADNSNYSEATKTWVSDA